MKKYKVNPRYPREKLEPFFQDLMLKETIFTIVEEGKWFYRLEYVFSREVEGFCTEKHKFRRLFIEIEQTYSIF